MKQTRLIMGMPITIEIVDQSAVPEDFNPSFSYFRFVNKIFSTYKKTSEISKINNKVLSIKDASPTVKKILKLAEDTRKETKGFFNIMHNGYIDPSGIVKGWAIAAAGEMLKRQGFRNFYINAGGDIQVSGKNAHAQWKVGIRNPFNSHENVKVLALTNCGIATSGTSVRGQHIYNPHQTRTVTDIVSLTVIGQDIYDADRFATAAFAMGKDGINFIENLNGFEGYMIDVNGIATYTSQFQAFIV